MPTTKFHNYSVTILSFFILFFLSATLTSRIILKGEIVSIPDLIGKTMAEAGRELAKKKLSLIRDGSQFSDRWEKGRVVFQEPSAGSKLKVNKTVKVIISEGGEVVEIPTLLGKSLEASSQILNEAGLGRGRISQIHTPQYAAGRVIAQDPTPSPQKLKRNTPVNLLVSQGEREEQYLMPDLIGKKASGIINRLQEMGFRVAGIRHFYYPGLEAGIIIKQFPPHGYRIQKRNLINLEVSK